MHRTRRNKFSVAVLNRKYQVNGEQITFRDFINKVFFKAPPTKRISTNEGRSIVDLEPGESIVINDFNITRIS